MPRLPRFRIEAIADLYQQLRFAPRETHLRQMQAAERLVRELDDRRNYPHDFIVYRLTGYRLDKSEPLMLVGEALRPDLVNFVLMLSRDLDLPPDFNGREALPVEVAASQLHVSTKTLQRYRRQGLVFHYVRYNDEQKLSCFRDSIEAFRHVNDSRLEQAAAFSRLDEDAEQRAINRARELAREGASMNEAAAAMAQEFGRSHEGMRQFLQRHDARSEDAIFSEHGVLTQRDRRAIHRAWRAGIPPAEMARRYGKTWSTIRRCIDRQRADILRALDVQYIKLPTFDLPDAATVILSPAPIRSGLSDIAPLNDAVALVQWIKLHLVKDGAEEALLAAFNYLRFHARGEIDRLPDWPTAVRMDAIETDLRWASSLKRRLLTLSLPAALRTIELNLHHALEHQPSADIARLMRLAIRVLSRTIDVIQPREQQMPRMCGQAMDRALARLDLSRAETRATLSAQPTAAPLDERVGWLNAWDHALELPRALAQRLGEVDDAAAEIIQLRYGLAGQPPMTIDAIAQRLGRSHRAVVHHLRDAHQQLRRDS